MLVHQSRCTNRHLLLSRFTKGFRNYSQQTRPRSLVYEKHGNPSEIIKGHSYDIDPPNDGQVVLKIGLAALNPADINVLQGVYPTLPDSRILPKLDKEHFIGGNEGFGVVQNDTSTFKRGDWVTFAKPQIGTWTSDLVCNEEDLFKILMKKRSRLTPVMASTLQVNPPTAFRMLHDFTNLERGDIIIQNAANSAVGQAVIQIASRKLGVETINLVRHRNDHKELKLQLKKCADDSAPAHVFTYEDLADKNSDTSNLLKKIIAGRPIRLGLNAVCGRQNSNMAKLMAAESTLVTYGAMSKEPFSVPAGFLIFKNMTMKGFMMNQWHASHTLEERKQLLDEIVEMYETGILDPPSHKIIDLLVTDEDHEMKQKAAKAIRDTLTGYGGKKYFFSFHKGLV